MSLISEIAHFSGVFVIFSEILLLVSQNKVSYGANCFIYVVMALKQLIWCQEISYWATSVFLYRLTSVIGSQAEVGLLTYEFRKTLSLHKCVILLHKIDLKNQLLFMNARYGCVDWYLKIKCYETGIKRPPEQVSELDLSKKAGKCAKFWRRKYWNSSKITFYWKK